MSKRIQAALQVVHFAIVAILCHNLLLSSFLANYGFSQACPFQIKEISWSNWYRIGMITLDTIQLLALVVYLSRMYFATVLFTLAYSLTLMPAIYIAMQERTIWYWYPCLAIFVAICLMSLYCVLKHIFVNKERSLSTKSTTSTRSK